MKQIAVYISFALLGALNVRGQGVDQVGFAPRVQWDGNAIGKQGNAICNN